jgi:hypothetical protein
MKREDRIRELCLRAIAEQRPDRLEAILSELRSALQEHCDHMRVLLSEYPLDLPSLDRVRDILLNGQSTKESGAKEADGKVKPLPQRRAS